MVLAAPVRLLDAATCLSAVLCITNLLQAHPVLLRSSPPNSPILRSPSHWHKSHALPGSLSSGYYHKQSSSPRAQTEHADVEFHLQRNFNTVIS